MSMVQVMAQAQGGLGADRTPFYGGRVPDDIKKMVKSLDAVDKATFRKLIQVALSSVENEVSEEEFSSLSSGKATMEVLRCVFAGILKILRLALRMPLSSLKSEAFKLDLKDLKIPAELIPDLNKAVFSSRREALDDAAVSRRVRLPQLQSFRWRVDVSISTSALNRTMEPSILVEMTLSNGKVSTFEVPVSKFHELRYNVAYVLKEMDSLEQRNILKLQD